MKVVLLDVDGVVIRPRHKFFSEKYSEEYDVPLEDILPFFKGEYKRAAIGEVDIREVLPNYLQKWGWKKSVDDFLKYWFESERDVDDEVLEVVRKLRRNGIKTCLASDNEVNRVRYVVKVLGLEKDFDKGYFSSDLGVTKDKLEFFEKVIKDSGVEPSSVLYWDDDPKNVDVAKKVGIDARTFENLSSFKKQMVQ